MLSTQLWKLVIILYARMRVETISGQLLITALLFSIIKLIKNSGEH